MGRPFKGLSHAQGPASEYDVVVIGAGIAGLVCANLLAAEGLSTLMIESHYQVGGYCSTFTRHRYTFDAASHFYPLLGNPESLTGRLIRKLGIDMNWIKMDPVDTFHFPDGSQFDVPADLETYLEKLHGQFPHQSTALNAFFKQVRQAYALGLLAYFREVVPPRFQALAPLTLDEVLDQHFSDPKLKLLLCGDCPHWGSAPKDISFVFDSMLRLSYFLGNYYPGGGSQVFANQLAAQFEKRGGHILMKSRVSCLPLEQGRVGEVVIERGSGPRLQQMRVRSRAVVANTDLRQLVDRLIGRQHLDPDYVAKIDKMRPSFPCYLLHLGLKDMDRQHLARIQGYHWNEWDANRVGRNGLKFKIFVPTLYDPAMAPPGKDVVIIQKVIELDYDGVKDWAQHKQDIQEYLLDHLRPLLPGLDEKIEVMNLASAKTSSRFTGNLQGAMLGWKMCPDQLGEQRPGIQGPLPGLYLTGHWTRPGGGITPVIISAQKAAQLVLSDLAG